MVKLITIAIAEEAFTRVSKSVLREPPVEATSEQGDRHSRMDVCNNAMEVVNPLPAESVG